MNMEDSGNSCGSSVVSDLSSADVFDGDGVQVSDLEENGDARDHEQVCTSLFHARWAIAEEFN